MMHRKTVTVPSIQQRVDVIIQSKLNAFKVFVPIKLMILD